MSKPRKPEHEPVTYDELADLLSGTLHQDPEREAQVKARIENDPDAQRKMQQLTEGLDAVLDSAGAQSPEFTVPEDMPTEVAARLTLHWGRLAHDRAVRDSQSTTTPEVSGPTPQGPRAGDAGSTADDPDSSSGPPSES